MKQKSLQQDDDWNKFPRKRRLSLPKGLPLGLILFQMMKSFEQNLLCVEQASADNKLFTIITEQSCLNLVRIFDEWYFIVGVTSENIVSDSGKTVENSHSIHVFEKWSAWMAFLHLRFVIEVNNKIRGEQSHVASNIAGCASQIEQCDWFIMERNSFKLKIMLENISWKYKTARHVCKPSKRCEVFSGSEKNSAIVIIPSRCMTCFCWFCYLLYFIYFIYSTFDF